MIYDHKLNPSHCRWVSKVALGLGLVQRVSRLFSGEYVQTLQSVVRRLTRNKDLQTVMCYAWGDFGTEPSKAAFLMMADLNNHFLKNGAFYPVGGSSEIALNIVPVIERAGGKVLVRADVKGKCLHLDLSFYVRV